MAQSGVDPSFPLVVSPDDHLVEPPALWQERLPARYLSVGPRVVRERGHVVTERGGFWFRPSHSPDALWADVWHYEDSTCVISGAAATADISRDEVDLMRPVRYEDM